MARPVTILFLGANPSNTTRLALDREVREIQQRLRGTDLRDAFQIQQEWAVRATDLQERLLRHRPMIVHFSGHGSPAGELLLEDRTGDAKPVTVAALAALFRILRDREIRCGDERRRRHVVLDYSIVSNDTQRSILYAEKSTVRYQKATESEVVYVRDDIVKLANEIYQIFPKPGPLPRQQNAKVIAVDGDRITIGVGRDHQIIAGLRGFVVSIPERIPDTNMQQSSYLGKFQIVEVDDQKCIRVMVTPPGADGIDGKYEFDVRVGDDVVLK